MNFEMPNQNSKEEKHKKGKEDKEYGSSSPVFPEGEKLQKEKSISPEGEEKKVEQTKRPDFLSYSRGLTKEQKLELSEETLERWQSYLKEEQYKLLVKYAQDFCEKRGLVSGERPNAPDFYLKIFRENGDIEALDDSQKEALRRVETLIKLVETRGKDISIAERFLLIRAAEDKIDILERDMKGLDKESPEFLSKKAEISKIRDLQADILSETYKDKEGNETFKTDTYKEAYERLREEYQGKGMLELYETLMEEARGETLEGKKIRGEGLKLKLSQERWQKAKEEFLKRRDEIYEEILGKKIKEIIGNFESAQGGIENWYSKIKDGLIEDLMKKKENGELNIENLDIDKDNPPKNEEEAKEQVIRAAEKISGENIPEESKEKFWKRWGKKIWEKGKGPLGTICLLIIAALIGIIAIEFGIAGYLFTKIEKGKR